MIRTLYFLLEKEFRQIMRNKGIVRMLVIAPVIQLILLPLAMLPPLLLLAAVQQRPMRS